MTAILLTAAALRLPDLFHTPEGILYDEAYNALDAATAFSQLTPFFAANFGREAGFIYLQALALNIFGYSTFSLRFPAACIGILTVAATYSLFSRLLGRSVGLLSAAWLSISFWHVLFSRTGLRAVSLPLAMALTVYCCLRAISSLTEHAGRRDGRKSIPDALVWCALAGALLGLSQYTYSAARFAPLAVLLPFGLQVIADARHRRALTSGLALSIGAFLSVATPLIAYFLEHPSDFLERARQVSVFTADRQQPWLNALLNSTAKTLGIFGVQGDLNWDRNISGLPALDPISYAMFLLGLAIVIRRATSFSSQVILSWLVVMLLPHTATSVLVPNYLRAIGVLPVIFALPALGTVSFFSLLQQLRIYRSRPLFILVAAGYLLGSVQTAWQYYSVWSQQPAVKEEFHTSLGREIEEGYAVLATDRDARVYISIPSADEGAEPVSRFYLAAARPGWIDQEGDRGLRTFVAGESLVIPPAGQRAVYIIPPSGRLPDRLAERHLLGSVTSVTPGGVRIVAVNTPDLTVPRSFEASWEDVASVIGYELPRRAVPGDALELVIYWKALRRAPLAATMYAHVVDTTSTAYAKLDSDVSLFQERFPDEVVAQQFRIPIPAETPLGAYWIKVGMYERRSLKSWRVLDSQGRNAGDSFLLGPFKIGDSSGRTVRGSSEPLVRFEGQIGLKEFRIDDSVVRPGGKIAVELQWVAFRPPEADYTVFLQLIGERRQVLGQVDLQPRQGAYPTSVWDAEEVVADRLELQVDEAAPAGEATLIVGLYDSTGRRLPLIDSGNEPLGDFAVLSRINVIE